MVAKQFTIDELEKMLSDRVDNALQILPDNVISQHFYNTKDNQTYFRREISEQDANAMNRNMVGVAKQLLEILEASSDTNPGQFSSKELKTMLIDYEAYSSDRSGRGDIDAENADKLPRNIIWITMQLIEVLK